MPCTVIARRVFTLGAHKTNLSSRPRQFSWLTFCFAIVTCARKERGRELCCALSSLVASHQIQNEKKRGDGTTNADNIHKEKIPVGLKHGCVPRSKVAFSQMSVSTGVCKRGWQTTLNAMAISKKNTTLAGSERKKNCVGCTENCRRDKTT